MRLVCGEAEFEAPKPRDEVGGQLFVPSRPPNCDPQLDWTKCTQIIRRCKGSRPRVNESTSPRGDPTTQNETDTPSGVGQEKNRKNRTIGVWHGPVRIREENHGLARCITLILVMDWPRASSGNAVGVTVMR